MKIELNDITVESRVNFNIPNYALMHRVEEQIQIRADAIKAAIKEQLSETGLKLLVADAMDQEIRRSARNATADLIRDLAWGYLNNLNTLREEVQALREEVARLRDKGEQ